MIHVCWHEGTDGFTRPSGRSGYCCCTVLNEMFDQYECAHWSTFEHVPKGIDGAVIVIQGGNERKRVEEINRDAATLGWVIFIIIGDEGCDFPVERLQHPRMKIWMQYPEPGRSRADRFFLIGYSKEVPRLLNRTRTRTLDWFFAGQNTHRRRHECVEQLRSLPNGLLICTQGFGQGVPHEEYFHYMSQAKVIPCPSGPASPDSFRFAEALEFGCVPIVDKQTIRYARNDFWTLFGNDLPFPLIDNWRHLPHIMAATLDDWDHVHAACDAWWTAYKADFSTWLGKDLACLRT